MKLSTWVRSALPAVNIVVVAAAALVWHHLPTPTDVYGPFDVHADAGTPAMGRGVKATALHRRSTRCRPPANGR